MKRHEDTDAAEVAALRISMGQRVREIRKARGWKLADLAERSGLAVSTISKMERGELSPTYDRFALLARGLGLDISELFTPEADPFAAGSVSVTRRGKVRRHETPNYVYDMHASDLAGKRMTPMNGRLKAHHIGAFGELLSHPGEEFVYVLSGELTLHLQGRAPITVRAGESVYFDSGIGHAYVSTSDDDAEILVVCFSPDRFRGGYPLQSPKTPSGRRAAARPNPGRARTAPAQTPRKRPPPSRGSRG